MEERYTERFILLLRPSQKRQLAEMAARTGQSLAEVLRAGVFGPEGKANDSAKSDA